MTEATYIHGSEPEEQDRLSRMQLLLNDAELDALQRLGAFAELPAAQPGASEASSSASSHRILDVGSGLGQMSRRLALAGQATVLGIERDPKQIEVAQRLATESDEAELVEFREGSAEELPLGDEERGSFDLAHARFLLEHVRAPELVVDEMLQAVRPGGLVALLDDDHPLLRFSPDCDPADEAWDAYWASYDDHGADAMVGRRLPELLSDGGAVDIRVSTVFYGATHGEEHFELVVENLIGVIESTAEAMIAAKHASRRSLRRAFRALRLWSKRPGATIWYSLPIAVGRRPNA